MITANITPIRHMVPIRHPKIRQIITASLVVVDPISEENVASDCGMLI